MPTQFRDEPLLFVILGTLSLCGCEESISPVPLFSETYVRFVSPSGANVLDSLNVVPSGTFNAPIRFMEMNISGYKVRTGEKLIMRNNYEYVTPDIRFFFSQEETLLHLLWEEFDFWHAKKHPKEYEDIFRI